LSELQHTDLRMNRKIHKSKAGSSCVRCRWVLAPSFVRAAVVTANLDAVGHAAGTESRT
jgi:hypothetical protein